jgi:hypothetical protein
MKQFKPIDDQVIQYFEAICWRAIRIERSRSPKNYSRIDSRRNPAIVARSGYKTNNKCVRSSL